MGRATPKCLRLPFWVEWSLAESHEQDPDGSPTAPTTVSVGLVHVVLRYTGERKSSLPLRVAKGVNTPETKVNTVSHRRPYLAT